MKLPYLTPLESLIATVIVLLLLTVGISRGCSYYTKIIEQRIYDQEYMYQKVGYPL